MQYNRRAAIIQGFHAVRSATEIDSLDSRNQRFMTLWQNIQLFLERSNENSREKESLKRTGRILAIVEPQRMR